METGNHVSLAHIQADTGARPVITTTDSKCPTVYIGASCDVNGLWFGGLRDEAQETQLAVGGSDTIIRNCVFFNYFQAIGEGTATRTTYRNNKFISCGSGTLNHSIYISNAVNHTAQILENIFLGGEAYHVHIWHTPTNTTVQSNFSGGADHCLAMEGTGHTIDHNVFWKALSAGSPMNFAAAAVATYSKNYHGPIASNVWMDEGNPGDVTMSGNRYYTGTTTCDPSPTYTNDGDEVTHLGKSAAQIDAAISALEVAFGQTVQQIHDDSTIETHFATLKSVIDTWKVQ